MPVEQPPITIGELDNVPQPESGIRAPWAQDVTGRIIHRFATVGAMYASNLPVGGFASVGNVLFRRGSVAATALGFCRVTPSTAQVVGVGGIIGPPTVVQNSGAVDVDGASRRAIVSSHLLIIWTGSSAGSRGQLVTFALRMVNNVGGGLLDQITIGVPVELTFPDGGTTIDVTAHFTIPAAVVVRFELAGTATTSPRVPNSVADQETNRLMITIEPDGN